MNQQQYQEFPAVIIGKGNEVPSKFKGTRIRIEVQFENGATAEVWGGGDKPKQLQELVALRALNIGDSVAVVQKFKASTGEPVYYLAREMYENIQLAPQMPAQPGYPMAQRPGYPMAQPQTGYPPMQAPGPLTYSPQVTQPLSPPQPAPTPAPQPMTPPIPQNAKATVPNNPRVIRPLDGNDYLHAQLTLDSLAILWQMALETATSLLFGHPDLEFDQGACFRLAERMLSEIVPYKLRNETFSPEDYSDDLRTPLLPGALIGVLRRKSNQSDGQTFGEETIEKMKTKAVIALENLFGGKDGRHNFGHIVFGKSSLNEWTPGELASVLAWTNTREEDGYKINSVVRVEALLLKLEIT